MKITAANMNKVMNTPEVKSLVSSYLLQKTYTQLTREKVDNIYRETLEEIPAYFVHGWRSPIPDKQERITEEKYLYQCRDMELLNTIYVEVDKKERQAGIKPDNMEFDYCPALVAENDLRTLNHEIIRITGNPFGVTVEKLLYHGLDDYYKWINLVICAVIQLPDFVNPLKESV